MVLERSNERIELLCVLEKEREVWVLDMLVFNLESLLNKCVKAKYHPNYQFMNAMLGHIITFRRVFYMMCGFLKRCLLGDEEMR